MSLILSKKIDEHIFSLISERRAFDFLNAYQRSFDIPKTVKSKIDIMFLDRIYSNRIHNYDYGRYLTVKLHSISSFPSKIKLIRVLNSLIFTSL